MNFVRMQNIWMVVGSPSTENSLLSWQALSMMVSSVTDHLAVPSWKPERKNFFQLLALWITRPYNVVSVLAAHCCGTLLAAFVLKCCWLQPVTVNRTRDHSIITHSVNSATSLVCFHSTWLSPDAKTNLSFQWLHTTLARMCQYFSWEGSTTLGSASRWAWGATRNSGACAMVPVDLM